MSDQRTVDTADEWLARAREAIATAAGLSPDELRLGRTAVEAILDLARIAAHESGDRRNAPLLCYLVGKAERNVTLDMLAGAVREAVRDPGAPTRPRD